jgi:hypothetical protein
MDIFSGISAAVSLFSAFKSKEDTEDNAEANASEVERAAQANREISLYDAQVAEEAAQQESFKSGVEMLYNADKVDKFLSTQKAAYSTTGISLSSVSAQEVMRESRVKAVVDMELVKWNGQKAYEAKRDLARRYRLLADKGLRDAAASATLILEAGKDEATGNYLKGVSNALPAIKSFGDSAGWWG